VLNKPDLPAIKGEGNLSGIVFVGAFPAATELETGIPFSGHSGKVLLSALRAVGLQRKDVGMTAAIGCNPPANDLALVYRRLRVSRLETARKEKEEKDRLRQAKKEGQQITLPLPLLTPKQAPIGRLGPIEACSDRLVDDLKYARFIVALGPEAASAILGKRQSTDAIRGCVKEVVIGGNTIPVGFTHNPARVLNDLAETGTFNSDVAKFVAMAFYGLSFTENEVRIADTLAKIGKGLDWLERHYKETQEPISYDVETDDKSAIYANLRCIGFTLGKQTIIVPIRRIDGSLPFGQAGYNWTIDRLRRFFPQVEVEGHNAGQYDRIKIETEIGVTPRLRWDTLILDVLRNNETPHRLGYVAPLLTAFADAWKEEHTATQETDDNRLYVYCGKDTMVVPEIRRKSLAAIELRGQSHLIPREMMLQEIGVKMTRLGMKIDLPAARQMEADCEAEKEKHLSIVRQHTDPKFNVNSSKQLAKLLYEDWKIPVPHYSEETGEPSTADTALRHILIHKTGDKDQRGFIKAVRKIRTYEKLLGTYLRPLRPITETYLKPDGEEHRGWVLPDGRLHSSYNRLPNTGRYSSADPNAQNIPPILRKLFIAEPGHKLVGCDSGAIELRRMAERAEAKKLLSLLNTPGIDIHNETMEFVYGPGIWQLPGAPKNRTKKGDPASVFYNTRGLLKNIRYAWIYVAGVLRIWEQVTSAEDDMGTLLYADKQPEDIEEVMRGLSRMDPEIPQFWEKVKRLQQKQGYIEEDFWQRRMDFTAGAKINELANWPTQASSFALVAEAMIELMYGRQDWFSTFTVDTDLIQTAQPAKIEFDPALFQTDYDRKTGVITNTHDSWIAEVEEDRAEEAEKALKAAMTRCGPKRLVVYNAESHNGDNWEEV